MQDDLSQYYVVQESPSCLILQKNNQMYIYKEFPMPQQIGSNQRIDQDLVLKEFELRKSIQGEGVLVIEKIVCTQSDNNEARVGILFESYLKNFDEELQARRGSENYWSEEELFNTFQSCLSGVKSFHENNHTHGAIGPQSIIFSQNGFVKIADHFVVGEDLRRNWSPQLEFGQWPPEVIADWNVDQGWCKSYETIEGDLWALGLVFLESMILQPSFQIYFASEDACINIDSDLLTQKLQLASTLYSPLLMGLLEILLSPDPVDRNWDTIIEYNYQLNSVKSQQIQEHDSVQVIANSLGKINQYIGQEVCEKEDNDEMTNTTKYKLTEMLESCLQKSKDLISQNESRKRLSPSSYFTLNVQNNIQTLNDSQESDKQDDNFDKSIIRSRQLVENQIDKNNSIINNNINESKENHPTPQLTELPTSKSQRKQQLEPVSVENEHTFQNMQTLINSQQQKQLIKIDYENNITYQGIVSNQSELTKVGFGTLYEKISGKVLYQGEWLRDVFHGRGFLRNFNLDDGNIDIDPEDFSNLAQIWNYYQGEFQDGLMNGKGQLTLIDNSVFQGQFIQGSIEGFGMYIKDGQVLIGQWTQNQLTQLFSSTF